MRNYFLSTIGPMLVIAAIANMAHGQGVLHKDVDAREVIRRGDFVEHVTDDRAEVEDPYGKLIAQIASTPESDLDKWYISVISAKNCKGCEELKRLWDTNPILRAYAVPNSPKDSWAHFTIYDYDDPLQKWRWTRSPSNPKAVQIVATPTVILQPPRSGKYGKPSNVVCKYVWEGDPQKLHEALNGALHAYIDKLKQQVAPREGTAASNGGMKSRDAGSKTSDFKGYEAKERMEDGTLHAPHFPLEQPWRSIELTPNPPVKINLALPSDLRPIGQQQIPPPLDLPNEPKPGPDDDRPTGPLRDAVRSSLIAPEIVIVRDKEQRAGQDVERAINEQVAALQPKTGQKYRERDIDISKANKLYGVSPDETPVVLLVHGKHVSQKLSALAIEGRSGFTGWLLIDYLFGGGSMVGAVMWLIKALLVVVLFFFALVVVVIVCLVIRRPPAQMVSAELRQAEAPKVDIEALAAAVVAAQKKNATTVA